MPRRFLITGGAGFVGSHLVALLLDRGEHCVVLDNLRTGHRGAVLPGAAFAACDLADAAALDAVLADGPWDGVFHFAAMSLVGESMREPYRYLAANVGTGIALIDACVRHGVRRFVFSSTAALFGAPERMPIDEDAPIAPGSPYGESKWMLERALSWADRIHGLRSSCLRYFNAAGADPAARLGEAHDPETHLIPLVIDAALGRRPAIEVFGNDYPTADGTCIRDYVHVTDLADAHLRALEQLDHGSVAYNLGTGAGHTVLEVVRSVERVSGRTVPVKMGVRRLGDPPALVADPAKLRRETGWTPRFTELDDIVSTAFAWREAHPLGYG
ncbi:MAG TPA: UDP-glucose 4-epimerase GalE [Acetobacteraceae bacterium]|jgi:UDP-glucose 4-epimerase|nr:UDP-glucose 4-epimerase GalE [Acetobacteraceae bacterium]